MNPPTAVLGGGGCTEGLLAHSLFGLIRAQYVILVIRCGILWSDTLLKRHTHSSIMYCFMDPLLRE